MFLQKIRGDGAALPPPPSARAVTIAALGGVLAVACLALLGQSLALVLILGSFGASCVFVEFH